MRKKIVAGNWKMNKTSEEAKILAAEVMGMVADEVKGNTITVLCVPFPHLIPLKNQLGESSVKIGGQNCSEHDSGAYTGEVSALMLKSIEIPYLILGHSERRQYFGEDGKLLAKKVDKPLAPQLTPILSLVEPLKIPKSG